MNPITCLVTGAAGFIGSHLTDRLLALGHRVIGIDNFRLGRRAHLRQALASDHFTLIEANVNDFDVLLPAVKDALRGGTLTRVWHLAANSDIRAGGENPDVDLADTFLTTYNVLRLMRVLGARQLAFASSSAIYGPHAGQLTEATGPLQPISNYGAMKLASEAIISAALETTLARAWVFRFPNVVGPRATHGVIFDFLQKLKSNPNELEVLGDGLQEKPYLHVSELVEAMLFVVRATEAPLNVYHLGVEGGGTTVRLIAEAVVRAASPGAAIRYTGGAQGWPGDVPKFAYSIDKVRRLGWAPQLSSTQAVERAIAELASDAAA